MFVMPPPDRRRRRPHDAGPRIIVTNDDGVFSEGIERLAAAALRGRRRLHRRAGPGAQRRRALADAAPSAARQARSGPHRWSVDGTPTDCVNWGVLHLLKDERPKLLFSGINLGLNLGDDVTYSGTVSAAFEGTLIGIPSVAISQEIETGFTFDAAAAFAARLARRLLEQPLPPGTLVNVNVPAGAPRGVRVAPPGPAPLRRGRDREDRPARPARTTGSARRRRPGSSSRERTSRRSRRSTSR